MKTFLHFLPYPHLTATSNNHHYYHYHPLLHNSNENLWRISFVNVEEIRAISNSNLLLFSDLFFFFCPLIIDLQFSCVLNPLTFFFHSFLPFCVMHLVWAKFTSTAYYRHFCFYWSRLMVWQSSVAKMRKVLIDIFNWFFFPSTHWLPHCIPLDELQCCIKLFFSQTL